MRRVASAGGAPRRAHSHPNRPCAASRGGSRPSPPRPPTCKRASAGSSKPSPPTCSTSPASGPSPPRRSTSPGHTPGRCRNEAAFARLAGVDPLEASSGQNTRHRLNRRGDRQLTARCTPSPSPAAATAPTPRPTSPNEPPKAKPPEKPNAASNATSPARSTASSNTPKSTLDKHRSIVSAKARQPRPRRDSRSLWVPIIRSWALTRGFALHPGTRNRYEIRYTRTQHRPPSRQANDHGRVSGTHRRSTSARRLAATGSFPGAGLWGLSVCLATSPTPALYKTRWRARTE